MKRHLLVVCTLLSLVMPLAYATSRQPPNPVPERAGPSPDELLRQGIETLAQYLKQGSAVDPAQLMTFLDHDIAPYFDFGYMARLAGGPYYRYMNDEQRVLFQEKLKRKFFRALAQQLGDYGSQRIEFYPPRRGASPNEMTVAARVLPTQGIPILLEFRFYSAPDGWKVFDVVANRTSAVLYYRNYFAGVAQRYGMDGLVSCC